MGYTNYKIIPLWSKFPLTLIISQTHLQGAPTTSILLLQDCKLTFFAHSTDAMEAESL